MTDSTRLPEPLASWAEPVLGPLKAMQDASHPRETRAYREAVPHLGHGDARVIARGRATVKRLMQEGRR
ncbi:hypothetical protein ACIOHS_14815 [Streptomyces sp. NPDC088253]|uniref:hypothetical protein n=1 Tax=Streptomyces sp. NPDC088253 TaxID=3365846 RepID=UPI0038126057